MAGIIRRFTGEFSFLSNFSPDPVMLDMKYPTAEHAFQAQKTRNRYERVEIFHAGTPALAKRHGRNVELRGDWEDIKNTVMLQVVTAKFSNPALAGRLVNLGRADLIEGNDWHDNYWGHCYCPKCEAVPHRNQLGLTLRAVRAVLRK